MIPTHIELSKLEAEINSRINAIRDSLESDQPDFLAHRRRGEIRALREIREWAMLDPDAVQEPIPPRGYAIAPLDPTAYHQP